MAKKIGRPPFPYTEELADEICSAIASNSVGIAKLCSKNSHWPSRETIYQWLANKPDFADKYACSKKCQIETFIDEILDIADDTSHDQIINEQGNLVCNKEFIARSRLRVDTRKWLASKLVPKVYGSSKTEHEIEKSLVEKLLQGLKL